VRIPAI